MNRKTGIGIVGCGNISDIYFSNLTNMFPGVEIRGCSDLDAGKAAAKKKKYNVPVYSTEELVKRDDIDIILNLTTPPYHGTIDKLALENGKHVYSEKPFASDREEAAEVLALAENKGLRVGCAPDTFLGSAFQTCRKLIDEGEIGKPLSVFASMNCHGHESWHPAPDFYYKKGGGPMLDMGPYYLTALVSLLGPVKSVQAVTSCGFEQRVCSAANTKGKKIDVEVPTHYQGLMTFENGAAGSVIMSFDTWKSELPRIEIHGTEGSLLIPDPNGFDGPVKLFRKDSLKTAKVSTRNFPYKMNSRGVGLADMADAIAADRPHRASGDMAFHVLDVMLAFEEAGETGTSVQIKSSMKQPEPFQAGLKKGEL
ncbi:Gfo/Idh/MocA family protein [Spirochaeta isovalerica]|uniref:Putative dehydrogenase n=1 Tax=Spirochaeta isovalerica TaxID=150 RepID=A0A841R9P3_9SPIO|nr:Gfo/Idh/MocA family oxidoreductase [Spirochaeta isovalerica]MBB6479947.1 putative dehydrogenase [Spirochaeta isovalerica]